MNKRTVGESLEVKAGRLSEACARYSLGKQTMREVAKQASAIIHIGNCTLINYDKVDALLDALSGNE